MIWANPWEARGAVLRPGTQCVNLLGGLTHRPLSSHLQKQSEGAGTLGRALVFAKGSSLENSSLAVLGGLLQFPGSLDIFITQQLQSTRPSRAIAGAGDTPVDATKSLLWSLQKRFLRLTPIRTIHPLSAPFSGFWDVRRTVRPSPPSVLGHFECCLQNI